MQPGKPCEGKLQARFEAEGSGGIQTFTLQFESFTHAEQTISRFISFYNNERLHSGVDYYTTRPAYLKWKETSMEEVFIE
ncbi:MAG: transposase [Nitrososphaerota archaeon]|nr:transposase [Nitrososphaerota archaeon]